jgi:hypothetical protein
MWHLLIALLYDCSLILSHSSLVRPLTSIIYVVCCAAVGSSHYPHFQIPADYVVNCILASTAAVAGRDCYEVFQVGTSAANPLKWTVVVNSTALEALSFAVILFS